ncbi:hypothetical protein PIB30_058564 [Stylosanthes scabra]|uniref:Aminotransferase-like plant mobile domain-containing protein n=1 Tax=Stylosanthes scabra TaxID=79078 RepID=A0ABU6ZIP5_9FABA|nr:hypothetical protein [Stylosanthes scabra]
MVVIVQFRVESTKAHSHHLDCFLICSIWLTTVVSLGFALLLGEITLVSAYVGWIKVYYGVRGLPSTFVRTLKSSIGWFHSSGREHSFTPFGFIVLSYPRLELRPLREELSLQYGESILQVRIDSAKVQNRFSSGSITWLHSVLATMSRRKTPAVKLKSVPRKDPPQLLQLPLRKWFPIKEVWEDYRNFYSKMLILPPRFLSEGLLPENKYPEFWELINFQGLRPLLFSRERYYPRMMAAVAATLRIHDGLYDDEGDGDFQLMFWLAGFGYTLSLDRLSSILGLDNSGVLFKGGSDAPKMLSSFTSEIAAQRLRVSRITGGKYSVSEMRMDHRLLQYILSYIWLPRRGNHGLLTEEDLVILWAMVKKIKLNWPYLIAQHLVNCTNNCLVNTGLGHGALWTKIFEHLGVDLLGEEAAFADDKNAITTRHLNKMGRGPKATAEKNVGTGEGSLHPQSVGSSTYFLPEFMESFTQGMQSFRSSWSENVQGIDQRLDGYESRLSNRTKEIQELGNDMHRFFSRAAQPEDQGFQDGAPDQE